MAKSPLMQTCGTKVMTRNSAEADNVATEQAHVTDHREYEGKGGSVELK